MNMENKIFSQFTAITAAFLEMEQQLTLAFKERGVSLKNPNESPSNLYQDHGALRMKSFLCLQFRTDAAHFYLQLFPKENGRHEAVLVLWFTNPYHTDLRISLGRLGEDGVLNKLAHYLKGEYYGEKDLFIQQLNPLGID